LSPTEFTFPLYVYFALAVLLLLTNGICAAAELAVLRSSPEPFEDPKVKKRWRARAARWLLERVDISLAASQLGRSMSSILLGWIAYVISRASYGFEVLHSLGALVTPENVEGSQGLFAAFTAIFVTVMCHLIVAETVAKSLSLRGPEKTLSVLSIPLLIVAQFFRPLLYIVIGLSNLILKLFNTSVPETAERMHSASDISRIVTQSTEHGVFDEHEGTMLRGVFGFSDTVAREVMTPRTDLVAVDIGASLSDILARIEETGFSRFPVSGNGIDDIHGILLVKDLLLFLAEKREDAESSFQASKIMRAAYFVPGTKPIDDLLNEFKSRKLHMAIVLDEHGGVDGLVTLEDLIEEIVGDIFDESDTQASEILREENGEIVVDGGMPVADVNDRLDLKIPEGEYDTIAGFIFTILGRVPERGDEISLSVSGEVLSGEIEDEGGEELVSKAAEKSTPREASEGLDEDLAKLLIRVEKVENHRIEFVRLIQLDNFQESETRSALTASQS